MAEILTSDPKIYHDLKDRRFFFQKNGRLIHGVIYLLFKQVESAWCFWCMFHSSLIEIHHMKLKQYAYIILFFFKLYTPIFSDSIRTSSCVFSIHYRPNKPQVGSRLLRRIFNPISDGLRKLFPGLHGELFP